MRTGKTKSGIRMASTTGMPSRTKHRTWVAVVDRARACFFQNEGGGSQTHLIHQIAFPEGRMHGKDLVGDKPGRSFDSGQHGESGGARHAYSSAVTPHEESAHKLVAQISDYLEEGRGRSQFDHLILVAEPHLLGLLREAMSAEVSSVVAKEISKDLAHLSGKELVQDISTIVEAELSMGAEEKAV